METQPEVKAKVSKIGNGYHILIPKALIKTQVLKEGNIYKFLVMSPFLSLDFFDSWFDDIQSDLVRGIIG